MSAAPDSEVEISDSTDDKAGPEQKRNYTDAEWRCIFAQQVESTISTLSYLSEEQVKRFREACFFMYEEHIGQRRRSGEPYAFHPLAVAAILAEVRFDTETLIAGLLHDVIEDVENPDGSKKWNVKTLGAVSFVGDVVAKIVEGVTKIEKIDHITAEPGTADRREAATIVKTIIATSHDIRVIMVKLADRLHNLRTMEAMKPASQRKKARETLAVYAPIAARLGMETLRLRLQELSYRFAYPRIYKRSQQRLKQLQPNLPETNEDIAHEIFTLLETAGVRVIKVNIREPLVQHVIQEFQQHKNFDAVEYRRLMRVVVERESDCYLSLGVLHKRFRYHNNAVRDYIAQPLDSGYQSLNTKLFGRKGVQYDGVIRTEEMHTLAQTGAAGSFLREYYAHEGEIPDSYSPHYQKWLQNLLDIEKALGSTDQFYSEFKEDLRPNEVAIYTPKGEVKFFPKGVTPIDFAYGVHTELGNSAARALVNGRYVNLSYKLRDGDTVQIITSDTARPDPAWARFAVTTRARHRIRYYFNHLDDTEALTEGQELLTNLLKQYHRPLPETWDATLQQEILSQYQGINSIEALYRSIGRGRYLPSNIVYDLDQILIRRGEFLDAHDRAALDEAYFKQADLFGKSASACQHCCPVPGDDVIVKFTPSQGMVIHHALCKVVSTRNAKRSELHYFNWESDQQDHPAKLWVNAIDQLGVVTSMSGIINHSGSNIVQMNFKMLDKKHSRIDLTLSVKDHSQISRILSQLERQPYITRAERELNQTKD